MAEAPEIEQRWNQLLDAIDAGLVVPVVGRELLWTAINGKQRYVPDWCAQELAQRLAMPSAVEGTDPVGTLVARYLQTHRGGRSWPYTALAQVIAELAATTPPRALLQLAELPFPLFVSTTSDAYLSRALDTVRFGGKSQTRVLPYGLRSKTDLPEAIDPSATLVFPLLGLANASADYAITEEDVLEFVHQFQASGTPRRLLKALRQRHLLLIGGGFSDWLLRFLVRVARPDRLWASFTTQLTHFVADGTVSADHGSLSFLQHPLTDVQVFPVTTAEQFVDDLHRRWTTRHPAGRSGPPAGAAREAERMADGGVFLSYCSEDYDAACQVRDTLDRAGLDVWFDRRDLSSGDEFKRTIAAQISRSFFCITLLSRHALTAMPRFFRFEWREAEDRARFQAFEIPYVRPVALEELSPSDERLPDFIRRLHWTPAPGGILPDSFVEQLVADYQRVQYPSLPDDVIRD